MSYDLDDGVQRTSTPVVKRQKIGEKFVGAIIKTEQRDKQKTVDGVRKPILKPNGKERQELVVHCITMPKTTSKAGIGDDTGVPEAGDRVRLILGGKAFGDWIEQRKTHRNGGLQVGDVIVQDTTRAQAYDSDGNPKGGEMTSQDAVDAVLAKNPRTAIGIYGPITLHEPKDMEWVHAARKAFDNDNAVTLVESAAGGDFADEEPF